MSLSSSDRAAFSAMCDSIDNHLRAWVIPQFQREAAENGRLTTCAHYEAVADACKALNLLGAHCNRKQVMPRDFIEK
jgi:hypothetical protein